jgi:uncharacterized protein (TIGR02145 family)
MKLKSNKIIGRNLVKFLIAVTVLASGIFSIQYLAKAITITNIMPNTGSVVGGQEVTITGDFTYNSMQQMTKSFCDSEMSKYPTADTKPDTITLTDTRNNQEYRIRKLADGKCWMIDNLKLELKNGMTLTSKDTNIATDTTIHFTEDGTKDGPALTGMDKNFTTSGFNTINGTNNQAPPNLDAWRQNDPSGTAGCSNGDAYNSNSKTGCGYLYNFYTAAAGTTSQSQDVRYSTAAGSICPAGWRLPTGLLGLNDTTNDFATLDISYGGNGANHALDNPDTQNLWLSAGAWQGTFSGRYDNGFFNQGVDGPYWSSSINSVVSIFSTVLDDSSVTPGAGSASRRYGFPVRCVIDEGYTPTPVVPVVPTVTFGGVAATVVSYSDMEIVVKAPEHLAGKVDVVASRGSQSFTLPNAYEYFNVPDVPNAGVTKASATTVAVQSGLIALIITIIATIIFAIKQRKVKR